MSQNPLTRNTQLLGYTPPHIAAGKRWYVEFTAFNPDNGKMTRKRYSVPPARTLAARRKYANEMLLEISTQLSAGWNPFLSLNSPQQYATFDEACSSYLRYLDKALDSGLVRDKTREGYESFLRTFRKWNSGQPKPVTYLYQMKAHVLVSFLDWLWLDEGKSARTRDNYLGWLRTFAEWLLSKNYISENPTTNITSVQGRRKSPKNRTVIPAAELARMKDWLKNNDRHFLLACMILYYCFIRPKEMTYIKIGDIHVKAGTVNLSGTFTKNGRDACVTLPDCVVGMMLELDVFSHPSEDYLFSTGCLPGSSRILPIRFCERWDAVRTALKWPDEYKFYSLKDTGITDLIKDHADLLSVRDQARHHSLAMTDLYTPMASTAADDRIRHRKGNL